MSKVNWKAGTLLAPIPPALVTCGTLQKPNILTVAWTGILCTSPTMTYISLRPQRYSYDIISATGEFVINLTTQELVRAADFCGCRSGRDMDKFAACHLQVEASTQIAAPMLQQSPLSLECRVTQKVPLGTHDMFMAEVLCVNVEESLIDKNGKLHLEKSGLAAYAHGTYYALGKTLGTFGFSVQRRRKAPPKR